MTSGDLEKFSLSPEQAKILASIMAGAGPFFVTGKAGTGKSHLLRALASHDQNFGKCLVTAYSGLAALNVGGVTLHSVILNPYFHVYTDGNRAYKQSPATRALLSGIQLLIIDEISMVRADMMDAIDRCLRWARNSNLPFGGLKIVMFGDPFQLPPFVKSEDTTRVAEKFLLSYEEHEPYFFEAHVFKISPIEIHELSEIRRVDTSVGSTSQISEKLKFIEVLNRFRDDTADFGDYSYINSFSNKQPPVDAPRIFAKNQPADSWNLERLATLELPQRRYLADIEEFGNEEYWLDPDNHPAPEKLLLRVGAKVMFTRNHPARTYVNGTMGVVSEMHDDYVVVAVDGKSIKAERVVWEELKATFRNGQVVYESQGRFTQLPLRLAWGLTVHKAQGQTLPVVVVDFTSRFFAAGQIYVALSRVTSPEGLFTIGKLRPEDSRSHSKYLWRFLEGKSLQELKRDGLLAINSSRLRQLLQNRGQDFLNASNNMNWPDAANFNHRPRFDYLHSQFGIGAMDYLIYLGQEDESRALALFENMIALWENRRPTFALSDWTRDVKDPTKGLKDHLDESNPDFVAAICTLASVNFDTFFERAKAYALKSLQFDHQVQKLFSELENHYQTDNKKFSYWVNYLNNQKP